MTFQGYTRRFSCWLLLAVALCVTLAGCVEVVSSPAPRPEVVSDGLGATRREWDRRHTLDGTFERDLGATRPRGLIYDGAYRVTYWVDGPQEAAPASARISRIEFDTPERDPEVLKGVIRELLPEDAVPYESHGPGGDAASFAVGFLCPSLANVYAPLLYTKAVMPNSQASWSDVVVRYSPSPPNVVIELSPWEGIPPESMPPPLATVPASLPVPVPSVYPGLR